MIPAGASVMARVAKDTQGQLALLQTNRYTPATQSFQKACVFRSTSKLFPKDFAGISDKLVSKQS